MESFLSDAVITLELDCHLVTAADHLYIIIIIIFIIIIIITFSGTVEPHFLISWRLSVSRTEGM